MATRADHIRAAIAGSPPSGTGWRRGHCPFCVERTGKADRRQSFGVHESGRYCCFKCGVGGRVHGDSTTAGPMPAVVAHEMDAPDGFTPLWSAAGAGAACLEPAREFLRRRGLPEATWAWAGIGACATGRYGGRVVVPIRADDGETWLGWVARSWVRQAERPYLYPAGMARGEVLYNHRALLEEGDDPVIVVEGVLDALCPGCWPDGVALLGKVGGSQLEALQSSRRPVAVVLDGDAWEEGEMLAMRLRFGGQRAGAVRLPPKTDPDEVPVAWLREEVSRCLSS